MRPRRQPRTKDAEPPPPPWEPPGLADVGEGGGEGWGRGVESPTTATGQGRGPAGFPSLPRAEPGERASAGFNMQR